ncbi:hypothetical protein G7Z17_g7446 [Cylindrodendrum hubeiense]|uniref:Uncharacterized protein n=1 Tax=Cylindrodendrum hubeiense TaxID=595255 RepID=A0A9P5H3R1_9HYPO|nr:hypothetical protein G7Z17_g7446 [Cylindrodendrum hubeiense]
MMLPYTIMALCLANIAAALPATTTPTSTVTTTELAPLPTETNPENLSTGHLQPRQSNPEDDPPPYVAIVTAAPTQDAALASLGYVQTTYYACQTRDGTAHCGWHIPVMKAASAGVARRGGVWGIAVVAGAACWVML